MPLNGYILLLLCIYFVNLIDMIDKSLLAVFTGVGFEEKEAAVYLALTELGQASAAKIATRAELKRPIVYHILERLKGRGYVQEVPGGKVKNFTSTDPSRVLQHSQLAVEEFRFMLPIVRALQDKGASKPRIEYFEGKEAILTVYRLFDKSKDVRFLTSMPRLSKFIPDEVESWIERGARFAKTRSTKQLLVDTPEDRTWAARAIQNGRRASILPKHVQFEMDFAISEDLLAITSFDPLFIVVMHSESIAKSAATLFDLAWGVSEELKG